MHNAVMSQFQCPERQNRSNGIFKDLAREVLVPSPSFDSGAGQVVNPANRLTLRYFIRRDRSAPGPCSGTPDNLADRLISATHTPQESKPTDRGSCQMLPIFSFQNSAPFKILAYSRTSGGDKER